LPNHENKRKGHGTYNPHENGFLVGLNPWKKDIITIAVPKRADDSTGGNIRQKEMRLFRFSRVRYYR